MKRALRYSTSTNLSLKRGNPQHAFAASNALCFYPQNAIYTFIPKNACSSLHGYARARERLHRLGQ